MKPVPRTSSWPLKLLTLALLAGCATALPDVEPTDIPQLERQMATSPDNDTRTRLGIAHYKAGDYEEARDLLAEATESEDASAGAFFYLGLAHEGLEDWAGARAAYSGYLDLGRSDPLKERVRGRLALMIRKEIEAEARRALAQEERLSSTEPTSGTVAVFPFPLLADNPDLEPLQVALADMMITDLSLSGGVTVLERTRIQTLLNEMALSEAGYAEPATGARAGRLLQSEYVVQGALTPLGEELRLDAGVLRTEAGSQTGQVSREDNLQQIFDLEKQVVFQVLDVLGVDLTPAEREAISENRGESLLAFLTYGRGLMAEDRGDFDEAAQFFRRAAELDPSFAPAQTAAQQATQLQQATATGTGDLAELATTELGRAPVAGAESEVLAQAGADLLDNIVNETVPNPSNEIVDMGSPQSDRQETERDATQESQNAEGVTTATTARIRITIPRPGSGGSGGGG